MGISQKSHGKKSDKETQSPVLKLFQDMVHKEKKQPNPEKTNLLNKKHAEKKRRHYSGHRSKSDQKSIESSSSDIRQYKDPDHDHDVEDTEYQRCRTQSLPFQGEKRESWWFCSDDRKEGKKNEDTCSCVSCALKKIITSDFACIGCLALLFSISVIVGCLLVYKCMPTMSTMTGQRRENERLKRKIDGFNNWGSFLPKSLGLRTTKSFQLQENLPEYNTMDSESDLSKILGESKLSEIASNARLREFYKKLLKTDAEIKRLKKNHNANNLGTNFGLDFHFYPEREKRSIKLLKHPLRLFRFGKNKKKSNVTDHPRSKTIKEDSHKGNNTRNKRTGDGIIYEKEQVVIRYKPRKDKCLMSLVNAPKDSKAHDHQLKHPLYKNTERFEELLEHLHRHIPKLMDAQMGINLDVDDEKYLQKLFNIAETDTERTADRTESGDGDKNDKPKEYRSDFDKVDRKDNINDYKTNLDTVDRRDKAKEYRRDFVKVDSKDNFNDFDKLDRKDNMNEFKKNVDIIENSDKPKEYRRDFVKVDRKNNVNDYKTNFQTVDKSDKLKEYRRDFVKIDRKDNLNDFKANFDNVDKSDKSKQYRSDFDKVDRKDNLNDYTTSFYIVDKSTKPIEYIRDFDKVDKQDNVNDYSTIFDIIDKTDKPTEYRTDFVDKVNEKDNFKDFDAVDKSYKLKDTLDTIDRNENPKIHKTDFGIDTNNEIPKLYKPDFIKVAHQNEDLKEYKTDFDIFRRMRDGNPNVEGRKTNGYADFDVPNSFKRQQGTTPKGDYDLLITVPTDLNPKQKVSTPTYHNPIVERLPNIRRLLQTEDDDQEGIGYEDFKEVLTDDKVFHDDEDKLARRKRTDEQPINLPKYDYKKYHPPAINNPNWKGPMPLYPDEINSMMKQNQENKGAKSGRSFNGYTGSQVRKQEYQSDTEYMEDYLDNRYNDLVNLAQAYSDYGVLGGKKYAVTDRQNDKITDKPSVLAVDGWKRERRTNYDNASNRETDESEGLKFEIGIGNIGTSLPPDADNLNEIYQLLDKHIKLSYEDIQKSPELLRLPVFVTGSYEVLKLHTPQVPLPGLPDKSDDTVKDIPLTESNEKYNDPILIKKRSLISFNDSDDIINVDEGNTKLNINDGKRIIGDGTLFKKLFFKAANGSNDFETIRELNRRNMNNYYKRKLNDSASFDKRSAQSYNDSSETENAKETDTEIINDDKRKLSDDVLLKIIALKTLNYTNEFNNIKELTARNMNTEKSKVNESMSFKKRSLKSVHDSNDFEEMVENIVRNFSEEKLKTNDDLLYKIIAEDLKETNVKNMSGDKPKMNYSVSFKTRSIKSFHDSNDFDNMSEENSKFVEVTPKNKAKDFNSTSEVLSEFFGMLANVFSAFDENRSTEKMVEHNDLNSVNLRNDTSNHTVADSSDLVYPVYDTDMIENIGHSSRVLLSINSTDGDENKIVVSVENKAGNVTVSELQSNITLTTPSIEKEAKNKTVVKRNAKNTIFWNDMFDDEYGVKADVLDNVQDKTNKNDFIKKSNDWIQEKVRRFGDNIYRRYRRIKKSRPSDRLNRRARDADNMDKRIDFDALTAHMKQVCKKAATAVRESRQSELSEENKESSVTSGLMRQLVGLMTELIDYQVQQKTCMKLPTDLQNFLQWLTGIVPENRTDAETEFLKPYSHDFEEIEIKETSPDHPLDSTSEREQPIEDLRSDCLGTLRAVQELLDTYDNMLNEDKNKIIGVKEYLLNQMKFLRSQIPSEYINNNNYPDQNRYKRHLSSKPKNKHRFLKNFSKKHTKTTANFYDGATFSEYFNNKKQKRNLRDIYYKAVADAKKTTVKT